MRFERLDQFLTDYDEFCSWLTKLGIEFDNRSRISVYRGTMLDALSQMNKQAPSSGAIPLTADHITAIFVNLFGCSHCFAV